MVKIKLDFLGYIPPDIDPRKIVNWKSKVFTIISRTDQYSLPSQAEGPEWDYTDRQLEKALPTGRNEEDFLIAITQVPLQNNYYCRRLSKNRVIITTHEIANILQSAHVPLENYVLRMLYEMTVLFLRKDRIPTVDESFTHDETRGCIFDMTGVKMDIIASTSRPILCPDCIQKAKNDTVSITAINEVQAELMRIRMPFYELMVRFVKQRPKLSLSIALLVSVATNLVSNYIYEFLK